ncbi:hypothetical protein Agabi119p4_9909 [Agaricus bisporus var. burnettii]|uniref:Uncharacterized protein n=1 Tax=Agaricus bisporus var. burnettii TaxID=192524 RepID=A0A8H7C442_AGABI|nr:hypothetical protein Agabi119p4_9909 [Agaricus bisporus var. burnettii]
MWRRIELSIFSEHMVKFSTIVYAKNDRVRYNSYGIRKRKLDENKVDGFRQGGYSGIFTVWKGNSCGYFAFLIPAQPGIGFPSANTSALQLPSRTPLSINREFSVT